MQTIAQELLQKTQAYWNLSSVWNNRIKADVPTGEAIELCSTIIQQTNLNRPLSYRIEGLLDAIVLGEETTTKQEAKIVILKARA